MARISSACLSRLRAYDFRDEWPDVVQETLIAVVAAVRESRLREPEAIAGYIRRITRNKFNDRLRSHLQHGGDQKLAWEDIPLPDDPDPAHHPRREQLRLDLQRALRAVPPDWRAVLLDVYVRGKTYEETARDRGIPLGTLKRHLREGLARLRAELAPGGEARDPIPAAGATDVGGGETSGLEGGVG